MKWYNKILLVLAIIIFSPIILLGIIIASMSYLFEMPKNMREYKNSQYYADFHLPYKRFRLYSPEYIFYNNAKLRNLPFNYIIQENGLEYFLFNDTVYLFPDFDQLDFNADKAEWEADYDGDWKQFTDSFDNIVSKLNNELKVYPIKLLVERRMFPMTDLNDIVIPECVFLTWNYENTFENEDSALKLKVPVNTSELYEMMKQTTFLCGEFYLSDEDNIIWDLYDGIQINICVDPSDCCIGISKKRSNMIMSEITHWHPTIFEIYDTVCKLGKRGNILLIRKFILGDAVLYIGCKENCPYKEKERYFAGKMHFLEAK